MTSQLLMALALFCHRTHGVNPDAYQRECQQSLIRCVMSTLDKKRASAKGGFTYDVGAESLAQCILKVE